MFNKETPWSVSALIILLLLGLGGIGGGAAMLADPSGAALGLPEGLLDGLFISDFYWPDIFLILVMGLAPCGIAYSLWKGLPWAGAAVPAQGFLLVGWILFQFILWGDPIFIQLLYRVWGLVLILFAFLPATRSHLA